MLSMKEMLATAHLPEQLRDPFYLPTRAEIEAEFVHLSPEERSSKWFDFCHYSQPRHYDVLTQEYIAGLGDYLIERVGRLAPTQQEILEVGAGSGRLAYFLNQYFSDKGGVCVRPTDMEVPSSYAWFHVEEMGAKEALDTYRPSIALSSWMPLDEDFTADMRSTDEIVEYVLIGEGPGGCCGHGALTWGDDVPFASIHTDAPFAKEGFSMHRLDDLRNAQMCSTDRPGNFIHSSTISFRRD